MRYLTAAIKGLLIALGGVIFIAWLLGVILSDRFGWSQWLLWIPTPVPLAALLLVLAAALTLRRPRTRWALSTLAAVLFLLTTARFVLVEHRLILPPPAAPRLNAAGSLSLVHWNATLNPEESTEAAAAALRELEADLIILTDAGRLPGKAQLGEWREGRAITTSYPFTIVSKLPILTRRVIVKAEQIHITLLEIDADSSLGRSLVLYLVDLPSDPHRPRMSIAQRVRSLLDHADAPPPDLVVGDFNLTRRSASLAHMFPNLRHAYADAGFGYAASFPRDLPVAHIDHVLLSESLRAIDYRLLDPGVSRHRLQFARVISP